MSRLGVPMEEYLRLRDKFKDTKNIPNEWSEELQIEVLRYCVGIGNRDRLIGEVIADPDTVMYTTYIPNTTYCVDFYVSAVVGGILFTVSICSEELGVDDGITFLELDDGKIAIKALPNMLTRFLSMLELFNIHYDSIVSEQIIEYYGSCT